MKIAFVVQRYGQDILGGAEAHCRQVAEHLRELGDIHVLTTCAKDYVTWENHYTPGEEVIQGVRVHRFPVVATRKVDFFNQVYDFLAALQKWRLGYYEHKSMLQGRDRIPWWQDERIVGDQAIYLLRSSLSQHNPMKHFSLWQRFGVHVMEALVQRFWMHLQGPFVPELLNFIRQNPYSFDAFIFFSYGYATTYYGLRQVKDRALLVPTAHDDPAIRFRIYRQVFHHCRSFIFNTLEEQTLVERLYPRTKRAHRVVAGLGFQEEAVDEKSRQEIGDLYGLHHPFILCVGRFEEFKGTHELVSLFSRYAFDHPSHLELCFLGAEPDEPLNIPQVRMLGFVSDSHKRAIMAQAKVVVLPSPFESLSMVMLEALSLKVPVLANGRSEVLVGQCQRSQGGLVYVDYDSFKRSLSTFLQDEIFAKNCGERGFEFVSTHYTWPAIVDKYRKALNEIHDS